MTPGVPGALEPRMHPRSRYFLITLIYLIAEQDVLSEQALNSKIHPARFLLSTYEVSNKRAGTK